MISVSVFDCKPYDKFYLSKANPQISWKFLESRLSIQTAALAEGSRAVCLFVNDRADAETLKVLADLGIKCISLRCAGYNNVDISAAKHLGITVFRVPAYSPHAVAEHTIGLLLTLNRKIHRAFNRVREWNFSLDGLIGFDVAGKTVGIIGTGKIGRITAQIFKSFDCQVLAYDVQPDQQWANQNQITYRNFEEVLTGSDIISLHVPLLPDTYHLIDYKALSKMKDNVYLINTSRGKIIDTKALISALKSGKLGGVALDTYEEEEGVFFEDLSSEMLLDDELSRLLTFPNVLITSHQGFFTHEALTKIAEVTAENLCRFGEGKQPLDKTLLT